MPSLASAGTNEHRCNSCGRYFNTETEVLQHEFECRSAKSATPEGQRELDVQDSQTHAPNDAESKEHPFQHGTHQVESSASDSDLSDLEISARAYECWHERGCPDGSPEVDWDEAITRLKAEQGKKSAAASA